MRKYLPQNFQIQAQGEPALTTSVTSSTRHLGVQDVRRGPRAVLPKAVLARRRIESYTSPQIE